MTDRRGKDGIAKRPSIPGIAESLRNLRGLNQWASIVVNEAADRIRTLTEQVRQFEQSWMSLKDDYSELARALGCQGDAWFGDPIESHQEVLDLAAQLRAQLEAIGKLQRHNRYRVEELFVDNLEWIRADELEAAIGESDE